MPPAIKKFRRITLTGQAHLDVFYMGAFSSRFATRLVSFQRDFAKRARPFVHINARNVQLKTLLQSKITLLNLNIKSLSLVHINLICLEQVVVVVVVVKVVKTLFKTSHASLVNCNSWFPRGGCENIKI